MAFVIRQLNDEQTLGSRLRALRKQANRTLREMAEQTKIRRAILDAFERDAFEELPEPLYARQFLRTYVRTLGADETYFLERFEVERGTCDFVENARLPRKRARAREFLVAHRFVRFAVLALLAGAVTAYLGNQLYHIISPPEIAIVAPEDGLVTQEAEIAVIGTTLEDANIEINGQEVLLNQDGSFTSTISLKRGVNVITITGAKRYSRESTIYRRVILDQESLTL